MKLFFLLILFYFLPQPHPQQVDNDCYSSKAYVIPIRKGTVFLDKSGKIILDSVAIKSKEFPACKILVESYGQSSERDLQFSWDKAASVIKYLLQKKIDSTRFVFIYALPDGDPSFVNVSFVGDDYLGPYWAYAPIPCYSYHKLTPKRCKEAH